MASCGRMRYDEKSQCQCTRNGTSEMSESGFMEEAEVKVEGLEGRRWKSGVHRQARVVFALSGWADEQFTTMKKQDSLGT